MNSTQELRQKCSDFKLNKFSLGSIVEYLTDMSTYHICLHDVHYCAIPHCVFDCAHLWFNLIVAIEDTQAWLILDSCED